MSFLRNTKGRALNKIFSIMFGILTLITLIVAIAVRNYDWALSHTFFILTMIFFGFLFIFLIKWIKWYFVEKKRQKELTEISNNMDSLSNNSSEINYAATFEIPYKELLSVAGKRYHDGLKLTSIISICLGLMLTILIIKNHTYNGISSIALVLGVILFFPSITYITQSPPYKLYKKTIPHRIIFQTSLLTINEKQYYARNISEIIISPEQIMNTNGIKFYRTITICNGNKKDTYCIDFRAQGNDALRYDDYGKLLQYCKKWCRDNDVKITVSYME